MAPLVRVWPVAKAHAVVKQRMIVDDIARAGEIAPLDRELCVAAFLKWFKRWFNESYRTCEKWRWQPGGFDRLLRTSESIHEKWNYIRENPVRAGLVTHWKQWPYQKGFADDE